MSLIARSRSTCHGGTRSSTSISPLRSAATAASSVGSVCSTIARGPALLAPRGRENHLARRVVGNGEFLVARGARRGQLQQRLWSHVHAFEMEDDRAIGGSRNSFEQVKRYSTLKLGLPGVESDNK